MNILKHAQQQIREESITIIPKQKEVIDCNPIETKLPTVGMLLIVLIIGCRRLHFKNLI
jgi:hypothetical protein